MIDIFLLKDKKLECKTRKQKIYEGENKFDYIYVNLSECVNEFKTSNLNAELRCYVDDEHYVSYELDTSKEINEIDITYDLTDKPRYVKSLIILTKADEVIGKTNFVSFSVDKSIEGSKLDPREDLDEIIDELRETIAEQSQTITTQGETISQQTEQITELNGEITEKDGQITELNTENTRLENLTDTQRETIQNMLDNPPQPRLYTPPVVTPSGSVQQINPPTGYDGLNNAVVDRVSAEGVNFHSEWYKEGKECLGEVGTYNPFPENSYGGIYYTELGEGGYPKKILIKDMLRSSSTLPQFFNTSNGAKRELREVVFENCPEFLTTANSIFLGFNYLTKVILPNSLTNIGNNAFQGCTSLTGLTLPDSLTSIGVNAFQGCTSLTNLTLAQNFNCNGLNVSWSTRFTVETIVACLEALADRTGQTAYTITFGSTNLNKLTAEQRAIATNKNWNLA